MALRPIPKTMIARLPHGEIEAVVYLKENTSDRYRYPAFFLGRRCFSKEGKLISLQDDFFDYSVDDMSNAAKDARTFMKRYQQNPKAALDELSKRQLGDRLAA